MESTLNDVRRDDTAPVSERDAAALWRRAAEIQADDLVREEQRSRDGALQRALAGSAIGHGSFSLGEVEAAARDAGIPVEYVQLAWLEQRHDRWAAQAPEARAERARRLVLGTDVQHLEVGRRYDIAPERILEAMSRLFPNAPFHLNLEAHEELAGGDGSILVFAVPGMNEVGVTGGYTAFLMNMHWIDLKKLFVAVRPAGEAGDGDPATDVTIRSPLAYSRKLNYTVGLGIGSGFGLAGGIGGLFGGIAIMGGSLVAGTALAPVGIAALSLASLVGGRALGNLAYRSFYGLAMRKGREGLDDLLQALALHAQTGGAFAPSFLAAAPQAKEGPEA